jgi:hypothetical protein
VDRLFLDTRQWNYLAEGEVGEAEVARRRRRLVDKVAAGQLAVVGSLPLQEIAGTYRSRPEKYHSMRALAFDAVKNRWLLPINERHVREAGSHRVLAEPDCYLSRERRREVRKTVWRTGGIRSGCSRSPRTPVDDLVDVRLKLSERVPLVPARSNSFQMMAAEGFEFSTFGF